MLISSSLHNLVALLLTPGPGLFVKKRKEEKKRKEKKRKEKKKRVHEKGTPLIPCKIESNKYFTVVFENKD